MGGPGEDGHYGRPHHEQIEDEKGHGEHQPRSVDDRQQWPDEKRGKQREAGEEELAPYSLSSYCCLRVATTVGSARVVVSPRARPSATSRSSRRMILPLRVLGNSAA